MKSLLKTSTQRRISIIGILQDFFGWHDLSSVAKALDCSLRTVLTDVEAINQDWKGKIQIDYSRAKGLRLNDSAHNKIRALSADLMDESECFQFLERVFFQPNKDGEYWMNELYLSEATFYRMIRQVDEALSEKGLALERKPFRITATDERWVRIFYVNFFMEKYGLSLWPFDIERERVISFVERSSELFDILLNDRDVMDISFLLSITIIRDFQGFELASREISAIDPEAHEKMKALRRLGNEVVRGSKYTVTDYWYREGIQGVFYDHPLSSKSGVSYLKIKAEVDVFLEELCETLSVSLAESDRKKMLQNLMCLYYGYRIYPYPKVILFDQEAFFSRAVQYYYPRFSVIVQEKLIKLEEQMDFPWFTHFHFRVLKCLLTEWRQLTHCLNLCSWKMKLLIISDSGQCHGKMLEELIESRFHYDVDITIYTHSVLMLTPREMQQFGEYDWVISNYPIEHYPFKNIQIVDDFLTETDYSVLSSVIKQSR